MDAIFSRRTGQMQSIRKAILVVVAFTRCRNRVRLWRFIHQKAYQQKSQPTGNALSTVPQFTGKDERMTPLHVHGAIEAFKIRAAAFKVHTASRAQRNQKGPFRLVRVHVQLLSFLLGDIVLDHVRFAVIEGQTLVVVAAVFGGKNAVHNRVHGLVHGCRQDGIFATPQRLFGVRVGGVLTSTHLFGDLHHAIAIVSRQAHVGDVNGVFFRDGDPVRDLMYDLFRVSGKSGE